MNTTPFFNRPTYFLSSAQFAAMKDGGLGEHILGVASETSKHFHYNWRDDLVAAKGESYQHFRPLKDDKISAEILALYESGNFSEEAAGRILNPENEEPLVSPDGLPLFRVENGQVQFDLIRVDFDHLTTKWQNTNLDAAQFALALVQTCITTNVPFTLENFEKMSSDIHEYWAENNNYPGQSAKLMTVYKNLPVDSLKNNQKDKDRVHIGLTVNNLSLPLTEASKNRSIVLNAMQVLFREHQQAGTLNPEFAEQLKALEGEIARQNVEEFTKYTLLSSQTKEDIANILAENPNMTIETFEQLASAFHANWVNIYGEGQDENLVAPYESLPVNDPSFNQKQFSRECVTTFLGEMVQSGNLEPSVMTDVKGLSEEIEAINQSDFLKYQQSQISDIGQGDDN